MVESHLHDYTRQKANQSQYFEVAKNVNKFTVKDGNGQASVSVYVYEADVCRTTTHAVSCPTNGSLNHGQGVAGTAVPVFTRTVAAYTD